MKSWTRFNHLCAQSTSHYDYLCRMSTKLEVMSIAAFDPIFLISWSELNYSFIYEKCSRGSTVLFLE